MCIFCQIANHEKEADVVFEDEKIIVFKDINPSAKVHLLIVPKEHIDSVNELKEKHKELMGSLFLTAKKLAKEFGVDESGYKLSVNVGQGGGQLIDHLHLHLMGGGELK